MRFRVNHVTHILCFVLGCSFTLLFMSYFLEDNVFEKYHYNLIILILSSPNHFDQRAAIRETWASDFDAASLYIFVIGQINLNKSVLSRINSEQNIHQDLLLLPLHDAYYSLTNKLLASLIHVTTVYKFNFLLKVDDDSFVNVKNLHSALLSFDSINPLYWGYFNGRASVFKRGKWKEDNWFLCDRYLPYALGGGYILTYPVVQFIVGNVHLLSMYKSEDVSVGTWLAPLKIRRFHDTRFDTGFKSRGCQNSHIISHKLSPNMMRTLHSTLTQIGRPCNVETEIFKPYKYDWTVLPSRCCS